MRRAAAIAAALALWRCAASRQHEARSAAAGAPVAARSTPGRSTAPGHCHFAGPAPSRNLWTENGQLFATVEAEVTVDVDLDTTGDRAVARTQVHHQGFQLRGAFSPHDVLAFRDVEWFGSAIAVGPGRAVTLAHDDGGWSVMPQRPFTMTDRVHLSEPWPRKPFVCEHMTLASSPTLADWLSPPDFGKAAGLPRGSAGEMPYRPLLPEVPLVDESGATVATLRSQWQWELEPRIIGQRPGQARVAFLERNFALVGWVDAAAVHPVPEPDAGSGWKVEQRPLPTERLCRSSERLTVIAGGTEVGDIDPGAPFAWRGGAVGPQPGRMQVSGANVKLFAPVDWFVESGPSVRCEP